MKNFIFYLFAGSLFILTSCSSKTDERISDEPDIFSLTKNMFPEEACKLEKHLLYNKHTPKDNYLYKKKTRIFQWDKIYKKLILIDSLQKEPVQWAIIQNYKDKNGKAPLVRHYRTNEFKRAADKWEVEQFQSAPLYLLNDSIVPERYIRDGSLIKLIEDRNDYALIEEAHIRGIWLLPKEYIKYLPDATTFNKIIFIDKSNQNIVTIEKVNSKWLVRSMNHATTGLHNPPYEQETPLGIFVIQENKPKMYYYKNKTKKAVGFAPYASRFCNEAHIHGVPVDRPKKKLIETHKSLGTTPKAHMSVRNVTSHAKFIYDWAPVEESLVFIIE